MLGDSQFDENELDTLLDEWSEVDAQAADSLADAWPELLSPRQPPVAIEEVAQALRAGVDGGTWPYDYFAPDLADGLLPHADAADLWLDCAASTISPYDDPAQGRGLDIEEAAALSSAQHADWLALVLGLVRRGVGAGLTEELALGEVLAPRWQALGALDDDRLLTELGSWGLPRALHLVWQQNDPDAGLPTPHEPLDPALERAALEIVSSGPIEPRELWHQLVQGHPDLEFQQMRRSLIAHEELFGFLDERWGHVPTLAEGMVLTHRVTREEIDTGVLGAGLNLDPWAMAIDTAGAELVGGGVLTSPSSQHGEFPTGDNSGIGGPVGWLGHFQPEDVVGIRYVGGAFELLACDEESLGCPATRLDEERLVEVAREVAAYAELHDEPGVIASQIYYRTRDLYPDSLSTPGRPLAEVLAETDLSIRGGLVGLPGTDWTPAAEWMSATQAATWWAWRSAVEGTEEVDLARLAGSVDTELLGLMAHDVQLTEADDVVAAMLAATSGTEAAVPHYLLAAAAEVRGSVQEWIDHLERARAADPTHAPTLFDLAGAHSLRGDARMAHSLYLASGLPADALDPVVLKPFLHPPDAVAGRNKPCPCGSGKKYKVCHGRTDAHPLPARAPWLWRKVEHFLWAPHLTADRQMWAEALAEPDARRDDAVADAGSDTAVLELLAFDGEGIARFIDRFGEEIPGDELELLVSLRDTPRRLLEVVKVMPRHGLVLQDLVNEEQFEVRDRWLSDEMEAGEVLLGRPLDNSEGVLHFHFLPLVVPAVLRPRFEEAMGRGAEVRELLALFAGTV